MAGVKRFFVAVVLEKAGMKRLFAVVVLEEIVGVLTVPRGAPSSIPFGGVSEVPDEYGALVAFCVSGAADQSEYSDVKIVRESG